jgi:hypothetical protein
MISRSVSVLKRWNLLQFIRRVRVETVVVITTKKVRKMQGKFQFNKVTWILKVLTVDMMNADEKFVMKH